MIKNIRKVLHFILKIEISVLFFILYYVVIVPMFFMQKFPGIFSKKQNKKTSWQPFTEKYQTIEDIRGEG